MINAFSRISCRGTKDLFSVKTIGASEVVVCLFLTKRGLIEPSATCLRKSFIFMVDRSNYLYGLSRFWDLRNCKRLLCTLTEAPWSCVFFSLGNDQKQMFQIKKIDTYKVQPVMYTNIFSEKHLQNMTRSFVFLNVTYHWK